MSSELYAVVGKRKHPVESWEQVSKAFTGWLEAVSEAGGPVSGAPKCLIVDGDGIPRAHVSCSGYVWPGESLKLGDAPLYVPVKRH